MPCENRLVGADAATEHLAHIAELERRDATIARELETVRAVSERVGEVRTRASEIRTALERLPRELEELGPRLAEAEREVSRARSALDAAAKQLEELEGGRRHREEEIERARSAVATARDELVDAEHQLERLTAREAALLAEQVRLSQEGEALVLTAREVTSEIQNLARVAEGARDEPGGALEELEEWGARIRAALFVVQGNLEAERERIVAEANTLGASVLGETLGASSVAVVRRRLEERLG
jgi:chromosome segregation protein